jgi:hypothetical protein
MSRAQEMNARDDSLFNFALEIQDILERVDIRCAAVDGPVTPTKNEIPTAELRRIYVLALKIKAEAAAKEGQS